jgi:hypothetical protein
MIDHCARSFAPMVRARIAHLWIIHDSVIIASHWDVLRAINVNNVPPAEGKNGLNTLCLQGTGHQMAPTNLGYNIAPVGMSLDSAYSRMALRLQRFCLKGK